MKKSLTYWTLALSGVTLLSISGLQAQAPASSPPLAAPPARDVSGMRGMPMGSPDKIVKKMKKELDLSDAQVKLVQSVIEERQSALKSVANDQALMPKERRDKAGAILKNSASKLDDIFTPAQKAKIEEMKAAGKARREKLREAQKASQAVAPAASASPVK
ncbi:MAG: hypothetical protein ABI443_01990 [Chthoniobacterales bacterium]